MQTPYYRSPWDTLGIAPTADQAEIRRAYARRLKAIDPETDPEAFISLRWAWDEAQWLAAQLVREQATDRDCAPADGPVADGPAPEPIQAAPATAPEPPSSPPTAVKVGPAPPPEPTPPSPPASVIVSPAPPAEPVLPPKPAPVIVSPAPPAPEPAPPAPPAPVTVRPVATDGEAEEAATGDAFPPAALFERIDDLLFGNQGASVEDELRRLTEALLAHPSLERIPVMDSVERWLVDRIASASPRSDPMLPVAAAWFDWAGKSDDWRAMPALGWLMRRLKDAAFERELVTALPRFAPVIPLLRSDQVPPNPVIARQLAPDVRDLAEFACVHYPTSVETFSQPMRDWWNVYFREQGFFSRQWDGLRRLWRSRQSIQSLFGRAPERREQRGRTLEPQPLGVGLLLGLLIFPLAFVLVLLSGGYSRVACRGAVVWTAVWTGLFALALLNLPSGPDGRLYGFPATLPTGSEYLSASEDLDPMIASLSNGRFDFDALQEHNPRLFTAINRIWWDAQEDRGSKPFVAEEAARRIDETYRQSVRAGDFETQAAFWALHADKLRWLRDWHGADACGRFLEGDATERARLPDGLVARERALITELVFQTTPPERLGETYGGAALETLVAPVARRTGRDVRDVRSVIHGGGDSALRCEVLIEAIGLVLEGRTVAAEAYMRELSRAL